MLPDTKTASNPTNPARDNDWYHQPIVWLGLAVFIASLAGCVLMIVLGQRYADTPLPTTGGAVLKTPISRPHPPEPSRAQP